MFYSTAAVELSSGTDCSFSLAHRNFPRPTILHLLSREQEEERGAERQQAIGQRRGNDADRSKATDDRQVSFCWVYFLESSWLFDAERYPGVIGIQDEKIWRKVHREEKENTHLESDQTSHFYSVTGWQSNIILLC